MKQLLTFIILIALFASCGSSQTNTPQASSTAPYTIYENLDVLAYYQTMPRGTYIRSLSGGRHVYKVSTPLEDGKKYRVTIKVPNTKTSGIKEAEIIAHTQL
ncbi:putative periplasmic lipoprotein [Salinimicrobium xinjiangense]|uniref:hypothetical protein n=1 Tax=Salinimicrobium xinjiangense TaxID=438596 RepID=UPI000429C6C3|nr:hypothetical protein [Salinimicrobium xinjiangense]